MSAKSSNWPIIILNGRIHEIVHPKQGIFKVYIDRGVGEDAYTPITIYGDVFMDKLGLHKGMAISATCEIRTNAWQGNDYITLVLKEIIVGASREERKSDKSERIIQSRLNRERNAEVVDANTLPF